MLLNVVHVLVMLCRHGTEYEELADQFMGQSEFVDCRVLYLTLRPLCVFADTEALAALDLHAARWLCDFAWQAYYAPPVSVPSAD